MHSILGVFLCHVHGVIFISEQFVQFAPAFSTLWKQVATNWDEMEHWEWLETVLQQSQGSIDSSI